MTEKSRRAGTIRTEAVCRHYQMGDAVIRAVDGISLEVGAGEFVALLGSSGSGKSSLLNLIAGLDRPRGRTVEPGNQVQQRRLPGARTAEQRHELASPHLE